MLDGGTKTESSNPHALKALEETHNYIEAAKLLQSWAKGDESIYRSVTEPILENACYEAVRKIGQKQRSDIWNRPPQDPTQRGDRLLAFARSYLDFPLPIPGGKLLRDAKAEDLQLAIEFYTKQAKDMNNKAEWLRAIMEKIGNKTVGAVWNDEKLAALKDEVCS